MEIKRVLKILKNFITQRRFHNVKDKLLPVITTGITKSLHNQRQNTVVSHETFV